MHPACARREIAWKRRPAVPARRRCLSGGGAVESARRSCRRRDRARSRPAPARAPPRTAGTGRDRRSSAPDRTRSRDRRPVDCLARAPSSRRAAPPARRRRAIGRRATHARRIRRRSARSVGGAAPESGGARHGPERRDAFRSGHERARNRTRSPARVHDRVQSTMRSERPLQMIAHLACEASPRATASRHADDVGSAQGMTSSTRARRQRPR